MTRSSIGVGLLGLGVVGGGVARALSEKSHMLQELAGCSISLRKALVRDLAKGRSFELPRRLLTGSVADILDDPEVDIVVEVMGGHDPALDCILKAVSLGKHVVTANKEVMAQHRARYSDNGPQEGRASALRSQRCRRHPDHRPLLRDLVANEIVGVRAIINGTTNYI